MKLDILIKNARIVTMAPPEYKVIDGGWLGIKGTRIVSMGSGDPPADQNEADDVIDAKQGVVMPGLIDTHFHTAQQFLRGKMFELSTRGPLRLPVWKNYFITFEQLLNEEDAYYSGLLAYTNMIKVGTTCFAESGGPHPKAMGKAMAEVGIRGALALSTMDSGAGVPDNMRMSTDEALACNEALVKEWNGRENGRIRAWVALRQLIVCSERLWIEMAALAQKLNTRIHTHLAEGTYEIDFSVERWGKRPANHLEEIGVLGPWLHCAHSALLSDDEVDLYAKYGVTAAHCPVGNFPLFGRPKVPQMRRAGIPVGIGSDGASNGSIDLFRAMSISLIAQRSHFGAPYRDPDSVTFLDMLKMATIDGAKAMGWADEIGSLEVGKKADILILKADELDMLPLYHPIFGAGNNPSGQMVDTTIIDGRIVMRHRRLTTVDEDAFKGEIKARVADIMDRYMKIIPH